MQTIEDISMTRRVTQATAEACNTAARASRNAVNRGIQYVRRNPVKVLLGAVGVGVAIALLIQRRELTWRERAFTLPVKRLKNLANTVGERTGEMVSACTERTAELAGEAGEMAKKLRFWS